MSSPTLPVELINLILDFERESNRLSRNRTQELLALCRVSKAFHAASLAEHYDSINLELEWLPTNRPSILSLLARTLAGSRHLTSLCRHLDLEADEHDGSRPTEHELHVARIVVHAPVKWETVTLSGWDRLEYLNPIVNGIDIVKLELHRLTAPTQCRLRRLYLLLPLLGQRRTPGV